MQNVIQLSGLIVVVVVVFGIAFGWGVEWAKRQPKRDQSSPWPGHPRLVECFDYRHIGGVIAGLFGSMAIYFPPSEIKRAVAVALDSPELWAKLQTQYAACGKFREWERDQPKGGDQSA